MKRHWIAALGLVTMLFVPATLPSAHAQWGGFGRSSNASQARSLGGLGGNQSNINRSFQNPTTTRSPVQTNMQQRTFQSSGQFNQSVTPRSVMVNGGAGLRSSGSQGQAVPQMNLSGPNGRGNISIDANGGIGI